MADGNNKASTPLDLKFFSEELSSSKYQFKIIISNNHLNDLNSIIIGMPCGKIINFDNSANLPVKFDVLDDRSRIYGFKISNYNKIRLNNTLEIIFEINAQGNYCSNLFETWRPKVAYIFAGKLYQQTLSNSISDIPSTILLQDLPEEVKNDELSVDAYLDKNNKETIFDILSKSSQEISVEIYSGVGIKISTMFIGQVKKGKRNLITFKYEVLPDTNYIYKISSASGDMYGKIIIPN
jgi:hypothetical protein